MLKNVFYILGVSILLCISTLQASEGAKNTLETYKKKDGVYISFSDGSGNINIGCKENYCNSIVGKYTHPHNIQQHKKSFVKLNENGTGEYSLWNYSGSKLVCEGRILKWGLLYKKDELVSPDILFIASRDGLGNDDCEFSSEAKIYSDFKNSSNSSSFKYFLKEN